MTAQLPLSIREPAAADLPRLAALNLQLIQDEGSRSPMNLAALEERMRNWITGSEWQVRVFVGASDPTAAEAAIVGYAVYRVRPDEYFPDQQAVYLRQMVIDRGQRGQGIGRAAFDLLRRTCFPSPSTISVDVLHSNPRGLRFWQSCGFNPYLSNLTMDHPSKSTLSE